MRRIDMFIDDKQLHAIDILTKKLGGISRSAFIRLAIADKIRRSNRNGY